jgi:hypothetical protein
MYLHRCRPSISSIIMHLLDCPTPEIANRILNELLGVIQWSVEPLTPDRAAKSSDHLGNPLYKPYEGSGDEVNAH